MKRITFSLAVVAAFALVGLNSTRAEAAHGYGGFGVHFGGPYLHLDVGNPHGRGAYARSSYYEHRSRQRASYHPNWHDTSHWDYHPPEVVRHGNHLDHVPGHFDLHRTGHWDRHRGYRRW
jgi:hypothetical protein